MIENIDLSMVDWARAQFALIAMYHWFFVPLTLGLAWLCAFFETIYVKTGNNEWKTLTRFWSKLLGINFIMSGATGTVLVFELRTNWSNYTWMVGDIFKAPLNGEGIIALLFLEAVFFLVMFFGWQRVAKQFHLISTWMVAIGSNLSAAWILLAHGWLQYPIGTRSRFNPDTARIEMENILDVIFSPAAVTKFTHATSSSFLLASFFVISISSWFLLKQRHVQMAKRSLMVAAVFGLISSVFIVVTGDSASRETAALQPMKFAAVAGLYSGEHRAGLVAAAILNPEKAVGDDRQTFTSVMKIPALLSLLATGKPDSFVPGINDLVYGNKSENITGAAEKIEKGRIALKQLHAYKTARKNGDELGAAAHLAIFNEYKKFMGYGYLHRAEQAAPPVVLSFYSFHVMVILGTIFPFICLAFLCYSRKGNLQKRKWLLLVGVPMIFFALIAAGAGWIVAEAGRQPWAVQDLLPITIARTNLTVETVKTTFFMFLVFFPVLLIAAIRIMAKQIKIGPEGEDDDQQF